MLRGRKVWVANAEAADVAIVFAATEPGARGRGVSAFLVPLDAPGIRMTPSDSLGVRGLGCMNIELEDVRVDAGALLGEAGRGFRLAMRALEGGRVAIAAQALGVGQAALDQALTYARSREAFGQPIGNFQAIQFQLADLATDLEAARMLMWNAADARDRLPRASLEAAMAKLQASEAAHRAADRAMQILASEGLPPRLGDRAAVPRRSGCGDLSGHFRGSTDDHRGARRRYIGTSSGPDFSRVQCVIRRGGCSACRRSPSRQGERPKKR